MSLSQYTTPIYQTFTGGWTLDIQSYANNPDNVLLSSYVFGHVTLINTNQMEDFLCGHIDSSKLNSNFVF